MQQCRPAFHHLVVAIATYSLLEIVQPQAKEWFEAHNPFNHTPHTTMSGTDAGELATIVVLAVVAIVCLVVVALLVRWLKKVTRPRHEEADDDSSIIDDISLFTTHKDGEQQNMLANDWDWGGETHAPEDDIDIGVWNPLHKPGLVPNLAWGGLSDPEYERNSTHPTRQPPRRQNKLVVHDDGDELDDTFLMSIKRYVNGQKVSSVVHVSTSHGTTLGATLKGDAPVSIWEVEKGGAAKLAGLKASDQITAVNGTLCAYFSHKQVVVLISNAMASSRRARDHIQQNKKLTTTVVKTMVVGTHDDVADAVLSQIDISLPGQISGDEPMQANDFDDTNDPFAPIREAASQHQLEAARLMQAGKFAEARVLLDRAIELLQSIPKFSTRTPDNALTRLEKRNPKSAIASVSVSVADVRKDTKRRRRVAGSAFTSITKDGKVRRVKATKLRYQPATTTLPPSSRVSVINSFRQMPSIEKSLFKPIKEAKVSRRKSTTTSTSGSSSTRRRKKPTRVRSSKSERVPAGTNSAWVESLALKKPQTNHHSNYNNNHTNNNNNNNHNNNNYSTNNHNNHNNNNNNNNTVIDTTLAGFTIDVSHDNIISSRSKPTRKSKPNGGYTSGGYSSSGMGGYTSGYNSGSDTAYGFG